MSTRQNTYTSEQAHADAEEIRAAMTQISSNPGVHVAAAVMLPDLSWIIDRSVTMMASKNGLDAKQLMGCVLYAMLASWQKTEGKVIP